MLLVGCADGGDKTAANDTDSTASTDTDEAGGGTDTDEAGGNDTDIEGASFDALPNGSFEADPVPDGEYVSSALGDTFSGWTTEVSPHGYASVWGGWTRNGGWGDLPAPAEGRRYLRLELWNQEQLPTNITAKITSGAFGTVTGGASCNLTYALSEVDAYTVPPLKVTVAWSESGSVVDKAELDVASATGYDVNPTDGAWLERTFPFSFPADADGESVTVSVEAYATNVTPGLALAVLVDHVEITCE
jgi:hypothetical protein